MNGLPWLLAIHSNIPLILVFALITCLGIELIGKIFDSEAHILS